MDATERFAVLVEHRAPEPNLDEGALVIAAHAYPDLDIGTQLDHLDDLAAKLREPSIAELRRVLFDEEGFGPNDVDYYDPRNSFLNDVIDRRRGIPVTLAVVMMEVGRRVGLRLRGIGLPGHFLVRHDSTYLDPFARGAQVTVDIAEAEPPVDNRAILYRMLNNLRAIYTSNGDLGSLRWVLKLRTLFPDAPPSDHHEHTRAIAKLN